MPGCRRIRPILLLVAEGDASPAEAIEVAAHLPECTACRIVLARERRVADWVRDLGEPIASGEAFVESVMSELPERTAKRARTKRKRSGGVDLAVVVTLAAAAAGMVGSWRPALPSPPVWSLPGLEGVDRLTDGAGQLAGLALDTAARLAALTLEPAVFDALGAVGAALGAAAVAAAAAASIGIALGALRLLNGFRET